MPGTPQELLGLGCSPSPQRGAAHGERPPRDPKGQGATSWGLTEPLSPNPAQPRGDPGARLLLAAAARLCSLLSHRGDRQRRRAPCPARIRMRPRTPGGVPA